MAEMFGWSGHKLAEIQLEKISKASFEIEDMTPSAVELTVTHDDFEPGSEMPKDVREGWAGIRSNLKSLLETGWTASEERDPAADVGALLKPGCAHRAAGPTLRAITLRYG
jgi:hypothetical protein